MKKNQLGQFFTKKNTWLTNPVKEFIMQNLSNVNVVLDPFAGEGDLFLTMKNKFEFNDDIKYVGLDIDPSLKWKQNDSLVNIPSIKNSLIITNPPYLSKNSCKRNGYEDTYQKYFMTSSHGDLYLLALEKMIECNVPGIAIVPETLVNSKFDKTFINRIVIIEPNPFKDTEVPICVVCFNGKEESGTKVYKNEEFIDTLENLKKMSPTPGSINLHDLRFNDKNGTIAIKGVDSTDPMKKILFLKAADLEYDVSNIKVSSRAITIVNSEKFIELNDEQTAEVINEANTILNAYREKTKDVLLSPFKGNNKLKIRRRRMDFALARMILESAYFNVISNIEGI